MTERVDRILERVNAVKLERAEGNSLIFRIRDIGGILHEIGLEGRQIGHLIKTEYNSWLPTQGDLELLVDYFMFLRALCEVKCFPSKEARDEVLNVVKQGEVGVVKLCKTLYTNQWKDVLRALKTVTTR